ncbi:hypothetical protein SBD_7702 [Streptomyces bottropensis ATCC 25435]|uniref:Uncharacterized protein n=1 Tax=Streptomyces bottropensis ATCC 25435 TaxID=1054862 RepID=M3FG45_9ACTN|nr:hypothetical protein SBD_7702 [Streptomyces bottropensis ATCC 25435]
MAFPPRLARRFVGARDGSSWGQLGKGHCGSSVPFRLVRAGAVFTDVVPDVLRVLR